MVLLFDVDINFMGVNQYCYEILVYLFLLNVKYSSCFLVCSVLNGGFFMSRGWGMMDNKDSGKCLVNGQLI